MEYNLNGGVLIIGSLFWQDDRDSKADGIRKSWRESRLDLDKSITVSVPIRYGRFSGSKKKRNQTYTMVFDSSLPKEKFGKAKVVPLKKVITNWNQLQDEVRALSEAEGNGFSFIKGSDAWCVCCIAFNKDVSQEKKNDIFDKWSQALNENQPGSICFSQDYNSYSCTSQGELEIPWPAELNELDFLIATSTQSRNRVGIDELTIQEIADYVRNREYLRPNIDHGIITYQDDEILKALDSVKV